MIEVVERRRLYAETGQDSIRSMFAPPLLSIVVRSTDVNAPFTRPLPIWRSLGKNRLLGEHGSDTGLSIGNRKSVVSQPALESITHSPARGFAALCWLRFFCVLLAVGDIFEEAFVYLLCRQGLLWALPNRQQTDWFPRRMSTPVAVPVPELEAVGDVEVRPRCPEQIL